jgi:hypothetical protein
VFLHRREIQASQPVPGRLARRVPGVIDDPDW